MNREERQRARKILKLDAGQEDLKDDACVLCAFVKVQVVGSRERLYVDRQGRQIELGINHRLEPPYGLRWPYDLSKRPPCPHCKGKGQLEMINLIKQTKDVRMCVDCYGLGKQLRGDEFSPLCESCAQFVYGWLDARGQAHFKKHMSAGGRLVTATPGQLAAMLASGPQVPISTAPNLGRFVLPR